MAQITTASPRDGKRALDHDLPLVPFIDLLLCCVMFLLATQVWNQLAAMNAELAAPAHESPMLAPPRVPPLTVLVTADRYVIGGQAGERTELPSDPAALRAHLEPRGGTSAGEVVVTGDDGVAYAAIIEAMDAIASAGFDRVTVSD